MRNVRKNFNVWLDGFGYAGQTEDFNAPKLSLKTEDFQGGGMAGPVELTMGMEKLECDFSLIAYDPKALGSWKLREGFDLQFTAREALESIDASVGQVVHSVRCKVKEIDPGTSKAGEKASVKFSLAVSYYKLTHGMIVVQEIDVPNMIASQNGIDLLAPLRNALGI